MKITPQLSRQAYSIDCGNTCQKFVESFWGIVNRNLANQNME